MACGDAMEKCRVDPLHLIHPIQCNFAIARLVVIPAKAGIHLRSPTASALWIPAFAGTKGWPPATGLSKFPLESQIENFCVLAQQLAQRRCAGCEFGLQSSPS